jgi:hypothetical protein
MQAGSIIPKISIPAVFRLAILFVGLDVRFHQTDDRSSLRFGSMIEGFDVFNDPKTFKVGCEALESPQEPQAQEF